MPASTVNSPCGRRSRCLLGSTRDQWSSATSSISSSSAGSAAPEFARCPAGSAVGWISRSASIGDPELIFLDEPTTGFDPEARRHAWEILDQLRALGKTIVLTSHYMDEVQRLADRVAVMAKGCVVAIADPQSLGGRDLGEAEICFRVADRASLDDLPLDIRAEAEVDDDRVVFRTSKPTRLLAKLTSWADDRGEELEALTVTRPSLEDSYLALIAQREESES